MNSGMWCHFHYNCRTKLRAGNAHMRKIWRGLFALMALTGSAAVHAEADPDPYECFNRRVFHFNDRLDRHVVKPAATFYLQITPKAVVTGIGNFFTNLGEPLTVVNLLMQGDVRTAMADTGRFVLNTTAGLVGIFDVAAVAGLPAHHKDFGTTLGVWGVKPGPYLMLPFVGPSTTRDLGGRGVDFLDNPATFHMPLIPETVLYTANSFNQRAALLSMEGIIQGDKYTFIRDVYLQHRQFEVTNGHVDSDPFLDGSGDDSAAPPAPPAGARCGGSNDPAPAAGANNGS